ncbi:MAG: clan AA aspartic protease [Armatimonadetes bacterium]|nr:clan AA aspartic protease [Armatimonadota bacterium]
MITGEVTPDRSAVIRLLVRGPAGREEQVDAVIDTGFNRYLTLPASVVTGLGLPPVGLSQARLADGTVRSIASFEATIVWDGRDRVVPILTTGGAVLVGMALLYGSELRVQVVDGGDVIIEALG